MVFLGERAGGLWSPGSNYERREAQASSSLLIRFLSSNKTESTSSKTLSRQRSNLSGLLVSRQKLRHPFEGSRHLATLSWRSRSSCKERLPMFHADTHYTCCTLTKDQKQQTFPSFNWVCGCSHPKPCPVLAASPPQEAGRTETDIKSSVSTENLGTNFGSFLSAPSVSVGLWDGEVATSNLAG